MQLLRIYVRSNVSQGASGASCIEEIIWGHDLRAYRIPGNDRRLPPDTGRKEGSHLVPPPRPSFDVAFTMHSALSRCTAAAKKERARVAIRLQNRPRGRNNPSVRSPTNRCRAIWEPWKKSRFNLSNGKLNSNSGKLRHYFEHVASQSHKLYCKPVSSCDVSTMSSKFVIIYTRFI